MTPMMKSQPKLSIVVPIHDMEHGDFFLWRLVQSLVSQTFQDFELIITQEGRMAENTNAGLKRARGELIKILYLDDYLAHPKALQHIVENFKDSDMWMATGCLHQATEGDLYEDPHSPHYPTYTHDIGQGNNRIGSPSVITLRNKGHLVFDEQMSWLLDCDLYKRYYEAYGAPHILKDLNVVIGLHKGQVSQTMSQKAKVAEQDYLNKKYE